MRIKINDLPYLELYFKFQIEFWVYYVRKTFIANTQSMFALLYQFWSYILSPESDWSQFTIYGDRHFGWNRNFEIYRETNRKPGAVIEFYQSKRLFYNHLYEEVHH